MGVCHCFENELLLSVDDLDELVSVHMHSENILFIVKGISMVLILFIRGT